MLDILLTVSKMRKEEDQFQPCLKFGINWGNTGVVNNQSLGLVHDAEYFTNILTETLYTPWISLFSLPGEGVWGLRKSPHPPAPPWLTLRVLYPPEGVDTAGPLVKAFWAPCKGAPGVLATGLRVVFLTQGILAEQASWGRGLPSLVTMALMVTASPGFTWWFTYSQNLVL